MSETQSPPESSIRELAGEPLALTMVRRGGNNRLYRGSGVERSYAVKWYVGDRADVRERYRREFGALRFLSRHGEMRVPRALALDEDAGVALYEWIEGEAIASRTLEDIDALAAFAVRLSKLRNELDAQTLDIAREAVFSAADLATQFRARLARLRTHADMSGVEIGPVLDAIERTAAEHVAKTRVPLSSAHRTLSPSDFGFHNALRTPDGLTFLDFEYFGWDDPVKLTADVLWHPAMDLDAKERQRFFSRVADVGKVDGTFLERFERDAPLYGLRWALIVLNEFLPDIWLRRTAAGGASNRVAVLVRQRAKALALVERVRTGGLVS